MWRRREGKEEEEGAAAAAAWLAGVSLGSAPAGALARSLGNYRIKLESSEITQRSGAEPGPGGEPETARAPR